ncbi:hypothetical protein T4D_3300 [Trichinella pseudospiralis]|uniref:Uncharacterized protein n=1 Tax=Trichinella pseudospiralis TaxID=6337 RepID=A0A0V1DNI4_TRIPS|nr:hypothetical protein T4D_3300 [Trichinella pseudospiralis]
MGYIPGLGLRNNLQGATEKPLSIPWRASVTFTL